MVRERITLNGIKRRGLVKWKGRERWSRQRVRIWSAEHGVWWRPNCEGYTIHEDAAGVYDFADAYDATKHCGPEKLISYYITGAPR